RPWLPLSTAVTIPGPTTSRLPSFPAARRRDPIHNQIRDPISDPVNRRHRTADASDGIAAVAFNGHTPASIPGFHQTRMTDPAFFPHPDSEDIAGLDTSGPTPASQPAPTIRPHRTGRRKKRRRPRRTGFVPSNLPEAPGHKRSAPLIALVQSAVSQVFTDPLTVVATGTLPNADLPASNYQQISAHRPRVSSARCRFGLRSLCVHPHRPRAQNTATTQHTNA